MKSDNDASHAATIGIVQKIIDYIEENLLEPLTPTLLAKQFYLSVSAFSSLFKIVCDVSVMEYIRNRRLSLAGRELMTTDIRIIDLSGKFGYETPEAFSKAFTRFYGFPPSLIRRIYPKLMIYSPLQVKVEISGGWEAKPKPEEQEKRPAHGYNEFIKSKGGTAMRAEEYAYQISMKDMVQKEDWRILLSLAGKLDEEGIAFKVDGRTMIFAHGLEFKLEKICLTFRWNDEHKIADFFQFDGMAKETSPGFQYFDAMFEGMKIRCMFFGGPGYETAGYETDDFLIRDTDVVNVDGQVLRVQSLEFYLKNAEPVNESYQMVNDYMKRREQAGMKNRLS
jgi:AraC-like DNA-binding protein